MTAEEISVQAGQLRDALRLIWQNWRAELVVYFADWLPWFAHAQQSLTLEVTSSELVIRDGTDPAPLGRFAREEASIEPLVTCLAQTGHLVRGKADVTLRLSEDLVLRPTLRLPKAASRTLRGVLGFELERLSPVAPSELYFDFVVRSYDKATNRVQLEIRALRRREFDEALRLCHAAGLSVAALVFAADKQGADWRAFPLDRDAMLRRAWTRWGSAFLSALALLLLVGILLASANRTAALNELLNDQLATEMTRAAVVDRIEQKITTLRVQTAFVAAKRTEPLFVATLSHLTDALPDGTWITNLSVSGAKLRIQGNSQAASDLIGRLDRSAHFTNAQFGAPLVRNSDGSERFDLSADIVGARTP